MSKIVDIFAREILDSRGYPTIEADVMTQNGCLGRAAVPSGASTGRYEAVELRDRDKDRYLGRGVLKSVDNVTNDINRALKGISVFDQDLIDNTIIQIDGTANKSNLGANAMLSVSLACARAACLEMNKPLFDYVSKSQDFSMPIPMMNILNGGAHADNSIDFQEFMIMPIGADSFSQALRMGTEIFHNLRLELKANKYSTNVGDEGGFAPDIGSNTEAIELVLKAIERAGYLPGEEVYIAVDAAASEFYDAENNIYHFHQSTGDKLTPYEMVDYWIDWINKYPIISIEDGLHEDDWDTWRVFTDRVRNKIQLVGDDLFVTNVNRLSKGINSFVANSILVKVNQIGTLTETIEAVNMAQNNSYTSIMSHRSGETEDTIIADLSVGLNCSQIKTGSASRSDRVAKYNQLLRIEEKLGDKVMYHGHNFRFL